MTLDREDKNMMAMMIYNHYTSHFGFTNTSVAAEVAQLLGLNKKTIRLWRKDFLANKGIFSEYRRGSYTRYIVVMDEEYRDKAFWWVLANSFMKDSPILTAACFRMWVNDVCFQWLYNIIPKSSNRYLSAQQHVGFMRLVFIPHSRIRCIH